MSDKQPVSSLFSIVVAHRVGEIPRVSETTLSRLGWEDAELIHVEGNLPSYQRNRAAQSATGKYLYFLDDDSEPDLDNLKRIAAIFDQDEQVAVVGGPSLTPATDTVRQRAFGHVLGSFWGSAWVRARYRQTGLLRQSSDRELILCNMAVRRTVFLELGGFDTALYPNEENALLDRLRDCGYTLMHDPDTVVHRSQRPFFPDFLRQLFGYGRGRAEQLRRDFRMANLTLFVFLGLPVYVVSLPFLYYYVGPFSLLPIGVHLFLDILFSIGLLRKSLIVFSFAVPAFFLCHFCYGAGMWRGLFGRFRSAGVDKPVARCVIHSVGRDPNG